MNFNPLFQPQSNSLPLFYRPMRRDAGRRHRHRRRRRRRRHRRRFTDNLTIFIPSLKPIELIIYSIDLSTREVFREINNSPTRSQMAGN